MVDDFSGEPSPKQEQESDVKWEESTESIKFPEWPTDFSINTRAITPQGNYINVAKEIATRSSAITALTEFESCVDAIIYVLMQSEDEFWMMPTEIEGEKVNGYRWIPDYGWYQYSVNLPDVKRAGCVYTF